MSLARSVIQEGLRGVVRLPGGTAHALDGREFPIPVMGKTGTTNDFRDALFVGSTYGPQGITVAVRIGFDDNRELGDKETGGRAALPDLPRDHARRLQAPARGSGPALPPRDRGRHRRLPERPGAPRGRSGRRCGAVAVFPRRAFISPASGPSRANRDAVPGPSIAISRAEALMRSHIVRRSALAVAVGAASLAGSGLPRAGRLTAPLPPRPESRAGRAGRAGPFDRPAAPGAIRAGPLPSGLPEPAAGRAAGER